MYKIAKRTETDVKWAAILASLFALANDWELVILWKSSSLGNSGTTSYPGPFVRENKWPW